MKEPTSEQIEELKEDCRKIGDGINGFAYVNFVDYSRYISELTREFPNLKFITKNYGIAVEFKEKNKT